MSNFIVEEELVNSIGRDSAGEPINEILFTVVSWQGRNFLYEGKFDENNWQGESRIAECVNGDYRKRYKDLKGWLRHILKRTDNRLEKIADIREELNEESGKLWKLKENILEVL